MKCSREHSQAADPRSNAARGVTSAGLVRSESGRPLERIPVEPHCGICVGILAIPHAALGDPLRRRAKLRRQRGGGPPCCRRADPNASCDLGRRQARVGKAERLGSAGENALLCLKQRWPKRLLIAETRGRASTRRGTSPSSAGLRSATKAIVSPSGSGRSPSRERGRRLVQAGAIPVVGGAAQKHRRACCASASTLERSDDLKAEVDVGAIGAIQRPRRDRDRVDYGSNSSARRARADARAVGGRNRTSPGRWTPSRTTAASSCGDAAERGPCPVGEPGPENRRKRVLRCLRKNGLARWLVALAHLTTSLHISWLQRGRRAQSRDAVWPRLPGRPFRRDRFGV